jgi:hypothetical protein
MRTVSATLAAAITSKHRELLPPRLFVDWDDDGFGAAGSLDDLTGRVLESTIDGTLQSDVPDDVRLVQGNVARTLGVTLGGGNGANQLVPTRQYFSPVAANSADVPLGGKERRFRACYYETGLVTEAGPEWVREFTGRTSNLPVSDSSVQLVAADNRALLRQNLALPALPAAYNDPVTGTLVAPGLEATWLITYILAKNGIYASPPPRAGVRVWAPMHGSGQPVVFDELAGLSYAADVALVQGQVDTACRFVGGPYVAALSSEASRNTYVEGFPADGTALYDQYGRSVGRLEGWFRIPTGIGSAGEVAWIDVNNTEAEVAVNGNGNVDVWIGGALTATVNGTGIADGAWHFVGLWWDRIAGSWKVAVDATVTTGITTALPASGTSPGEHWPWQVFAAQGAAVAEVHVTAGTAAGDLWLNAIPFTAGALIDRSDNILTGIVPDSSAADSWELLKSIAAAERGAIYFDADGRCRYRTPSALVTAQAQTVQATLSALTNITKIAIEPDQSRVRNIITCPWTQVVVHDTQPDHAYDVDNVIALPPGQTTTQIVTLKGPTVGRTLGLTFSVNTAAAGTGTAAGPVSAPGARTASAGNVTVTVTLVTSTTARLDIANGNSGWRYLVDTTGAGALAVLGVYTTIDTSVAAQTAQDQDSIDLYGSMSQAIGASVWRQSAGWAAGVAQQTLADTKNPIPAITDLECIADPRVEYYDRVQISDENGTLVNGTFWLKSIRVHRSGSDYRMTVAATATRDIAVFDALPGFDVGVFS